MSRGARSGWRPERTGHPGRPGEPQIQGDQRRRQAIEQALRKATAGDVVIVAGKGHEQYQIIGTTKLPFSDQETVAALVNQLGL